MWIKICGIRDVPAARDAARCAPDAIGLNFYAPSPRSTTLEAARRITAALPSRIEPVAVFVNETVERIDEVCTKCGVRTIQLHGDEPPELVAELQHLDVIRAYRVGADGLDSVAVDLDRCRNLNVRLRACLVDARVDGEYGGTGRTAPWDVLADGWKPDWPPLLLAGGLTPENVDTAIRRVNPWGVDAASGVESAPGVKDPSRVAQLIAAVRRY